MTFAPTASMSSLTERSLEGTAVITLEQVRDDLSDDVLRTLRLDDIARMRLRGFEAPPVGPEDIEKLRTVLSEPRSAANEAMRETWAASPKGPEGHIRHVVAYAKLVG